jgi:hypothetical protein
MPNKGTASADDSTGDWPMFVPIQKSLEEPAFNILKELCGASPQCPGKACPNTGQVVFPEQELAETSSSGISQGFIHVITPDHIKQEDCSDDVHYKDPDTYDLAPINLSCTSDNLLEETSDTSATETLDFSHRRKTAKPQRLLSNGASKSGQYSQRKNGAMKETKQESKIMQLVEEFPDTDTLFEGLYTTKIHTGIL